MISSFPTSVCFIACLLGTASISQAQQASVDEQYIQAQAVFVRGLTQAYIGNHDVAVTLFLQSLSVNPDNADILIELSKSYLGLEDLESAVFYAESAADRSSTDADFVHLADLYSEIGRIDDAIAIVEQLSRQSPLNVEYLLIQTRYLIRDQRHEEAAQVLVALPPVVPAVSPSIYALAVELFRRVASENQLDVIIDGISQGGGVTIPVTIALGDVLAERGRQSQAIDLLSPLKNNAIVGAEIAERLTVLSNASNNRPKDETSPLASGDLLDRARQLVEFDDTTGFSEAEDILKHVVLTDPSVESQMLLGDLYYKTNRFSEAADRYSTALESEVRVREIWQKSAGSLFRADRIPDAIAIATDGLLFFPDDSGLLEILAFASFSSGADDLSRATFMRAIETADGDPSRTAIYWMALANISMRSGEMDEALRELETAQLHDPLNPIINARAGLVNALLGNDRLALEQVNLALNQNPVSPFILYAAGRIYFSNGLLEEALDYVTTIFRYRSTIDDLELAGDIHFALNNPEDARDYWARALAKDPDRFDLLEKVQQLPQ